MAELDKKGLEAAAKALHADIEESLGAADWQSAGISYKEARLHDAETAIRAYLAALITRPVEAGVPKVKALEWKDGDARTGFGSAYTTHQQGDGLFAAIGCGSFVGTTHPTRDAAKAAAQADYDRRILFALDLPTSPATGDVGC